METASIGHNNQQLERVSVGDGVENLDGQSRGNLLEDIWASTISLWKKQDFSEKQSTHELVFADNIYPSSAASSGDILTKDGCTYNLYTTSSSRVLIDYVEKNFDKIDTNHDGAMTSEELVTALSDCSISDEERKAAELLRVRMDDFQSVFSDSADGLSKADIERFKELYEMYVSNLYTGNLSDEVQFVADIQDILTQE